MAVNPRASWLWNWVFVFWYWRNKRWQLLSGCHYFIEILWSSRRPADSSGAAAIQVTYHQVDTWYFLTVGQGGQLHDAHNGVSYVQTYFVIHSGALTPSNPCDCRADGTTLLYVCPAHHPLLQRPCALQWAQTYTHSPGYITLCQRRTERGDIVAGTSHTRKHEKDCACICISRKSIGAQVCDNHILVCHHS